MQKEEQAQRAALPSSLRRRRSPGDEDWTAYQKYDMFKELLASSPMLEVYHCQPVFGILMSDIEFSTVAMILPLLQARSEGCWDSPSWVLVLKALNTCRRPGSSRCRRC